MQQKEIEYWKCALSAPGSQQSLNDKQTVCRSIGNTKPDKLSNIKVAFLQLLRAAVQSREVVIQRSRAALSTNQNQIEQRGQADNWWHKQDTEHRNLREKAVVLKKYIKLDKYTFYINEIVINELVHAHIHLYMYGNVYIC